MNANLYEGLNIEKLKRKPEGVQAVKLSSVFSPDDSSDNRVNQIDRFFKGYKGFTYKSFHELFTGDLTLKGKKGKAILNPFRGFTGKFNIEIFGQRTNSLDTGKEIFDEYIETFFMYLCYQIFVKLFIRKDELISQNKENIEKAKKILSAVSPGSMPNITEGLGDLYSLLYRSLIPSKINFTRMTDEDIYSYIEQFANSNINLFTRYPLSSSIDKTTTDSPEKLANLIFDACNNSADEIKDSKQLAAIKFITSMMSGGTLDFDAGGVQSAIDKNPSFKSIQTQEIIFTEKNQVAVNDIIETLYSFDNFSSIDLQWIKDTPWESIVRFIFAVLCTSELSKSIKDKTKDLQTSAIAWQKKLDAESQDGGVYFINNNATLQAFLEVNELKTLKTDLSSLINSISSRTAQFQDMNGNRLLDAMFAGRYDSSASLQLIQNIENNHKNVIKNIIHITGLNFPTIEEAASSVNRVFLFNDIMPPQYMGSSSITQFGDALSYAKNTVAGFDFDTITKSEIDAFKPSAIYDTVFKEIPSTIANAFTNFVNTWDFGQLGKDLTRDFNFMSVEKSENSEYFIIKNSSGNIVKEIKTPSDLVSYLGTNCMAMGSIICHGKISMGNESLDKYFNSLSWLIQVTEKKFGESKSKAIFGGDQFPIVYGVTPFFVEYLKYSLRSFVNNIHKIEEVDDSLRKEIEESHSKNTMEDDKVNELIGRLKDAIKIHLQKKMKTL